MPAWQWLVAACREEAEARTAENLQKLRDMILELQSDWVVAEILLKTMKIGTEFGIGLCSRKLLPEEEVSKLAAILQQAKDILCRELPRPV